MGGGGGRDRSVKVSTHSKSTWNTIRSDSDWIEFKLIFIFAPFVPIWAPGKEGGQGRERGEGEEKEGRGGRGKGGRRRRERERGREGGRKGQKGEEGGRSAARAAAVLEPRFFFVS